MEFTKQDISNIKDFTDAALAELDREDFELSRDYKGITSKFVNTINNSDDVKRKILDIMSSKAARQHFVHGWCVTSYATISGTHEGGSLEHYLGYEKDAEYLVLELADLLTEYDYHFNDDRENTPSFHEILLEAFNNHQHQLTIDECEEYGVSHTSTDTVEHMLTYEYYDDLTQVYRDYLSRDDLTAEQRQRGQELLDEELERIAEDED